MADDGAKTGNNTEENTPRPQKGHDSAAKLW